MGIFSKKENDYLDDIIKIQKDSLRNTNRALSSVNKSIKNEKKQQRKIKFKRIIRKVAARPISRADGMEMMFGTRDLRNTYRQRKY